VCSNRLAGTHLDENALFSIALQASIATFAIRRGQITQNELLRLYIPAMLLLKSAIGSPTLDRRRPSAERLKAPPESHHFGPGLAPYGHQLWADSEHFYGVLMIDSTRP
jgi:hypothetical protein